MVPLEQQLGPVLYWIVMIYGLGVGVLLTAGLIFLVGAALRDVFNRG